MARRSSFPISTPSILASTMRKPGFGGRPKLWIKVQNRKHPAFSGVVGALPQVQPGPTPVTSDHEPV